MELIDRKKERVNAQFKSGQLVATRGVVEKLDSETIYCLIHRHLTGDWGDLSEGDKRLNDEAVATGEDRILSMYMVNNEKVYIITEWDRSATTVLFADEY